MEKYMGIDIGGTNIKIGIVDRKGGMESKIKYPTSKLRKSGDFVGKFIEILEAEFAKNPEIKKIGIGVPGTISLDRTTLLEIPSTPVLNGVALKPVLEAYFPDKTFLLENDANVAALGEYYFSSTETPENYIFITLGTGVGGAVIIGKEIFKGGDGNGLEIGHMLTKNGKTLEKNIGKKGIMKLSARLMKKHKTSLKDIEELDPKKIIFEAEKGDKVARKVYKEVGELLGEALVSVIRLLDIKTILIGGGLSVSFDIIAKEIQKILNRDLTNYYTDKMEIRKAELGNDAGIIGAASLCFK